MENIIKLNINKTAKREKEVFTSWKQYIIATASVPLIPSCGYPFQLLISIFVVTLYNDLADRASQAAL